MPTLINYVNEQIIRELSRMQCLVTFECVYACIENFPTVVNYFSKNRKAHYVGSIIMFIHL